jgi:hypothetical protein
MLQPPVVGEFGGLWIDAGRKPPTDRHTQLSYGLERALANLEVGQGLNSIGCIQAVTQIWRDFEASFT